MQYLVVAVPVDYKFDTEIQQDVPSDPQPAVKNATSPKLVVADTPQDAARLLAQQQNPGFPAEYLVLSGDSATVTLTAA